MAGLPGGVSEAPRITAEKRGDREQAPEIKGGGDDGAEPTGEEGAGGHHP